MKYKHPLPARLFKKYEKKVFRSFYVTVIAYMFIVFIILKTKNCDIDVSKVKMGSINIPDKNFNGIDYKEPNFEPFQNTKKQIEEPKEIPEEKISISKPPPLPWGDNDPTWKDSQKYPSYYLNWLNKKHPNYEAIMVKAMITAYTPHPSSCGPNAKGITATMGDAWTRGIAVPKPLLTQWRKNGTKVHVPGYMWQSYPGCIWKPDDCGSALLRTWRGGMLHIDVRFYNEGWAREWGVKYGYVFILRPKNGH